MYTIRYVRDNYIMDELWDGTEELKFRKSGKTLATLYMKTDKVVALVIFGKAEREKYEAALEQFSDYINRYYQTSRTYHDGKWMFIDVNNIYIASEIKELIHIKKKPNRKLKTENHIDSWLNWKITDVINYDSKKVINGLPQFGFHDYLGNCYLVENGENYIGLIQNGSLTWTAGATNPHESVVHYTVELSSPKYISRAFCEDSILIAEEHFIYKMDLSTNTFKRHINKKDFGLKEIGNCVYDLNNDIWVNDITGCKVFHFNFEGELIEKIGVDQAGFQKGTVSFKDAQFNWIYDLRLGADGNIYVLDSKNFAVRKIDKVNKVVSTICGDGIGDYCGDGGDAKLARLGTHEGEHFDGPWSLFVDEKNNIFIGDTQNHVVRMIESNTNKIYTIVRDTCKNGNKTNVFLERICGMDYYCHTLYIPDWRSDNPNTLIIIQNVN